MTKFVPLRVVAALAAMTLLAACGDESGAPASDRPDPTGARDLVLETARLILNDPDFEAACQNISAKRRSGLCTEDVRSITHALWVDLATGDGLRG